MSVPEEIDRGWTDETPPERVPSNLRQSRCVGAGKEKAGKNRGLGFGRTNSQQRGQVLSRIESVTLNHDLTNVPGAYGGCLAITYVSRQRSRGVGEPTSSRLSLRDSRSGTTFTTANENEKGPSWRRMVINRGLGAFAPKANGLLIDRHRNSMAGSLLSLPNDWARRSTVVRVVSNPQRDVANSE